MQMFKRGTLPLVVLASLCVSCGKKELDRATAMRLVQGTTVEAVQLTYSRNMSGGADPITAAYHQLSNAGLLHCRFTPTFISQELIECNEGSLVVGNIVVTGVTGVSGTGDNSAVADLTLAFQPAPFYAKYQSAFDQLETSTNQLSGNVRSRTQRTAARATFQLFDNGWRLQSIQ